MWQRCIGNIDFIIGGRAWSWMWYGTWIGVWLAGKLRPYIRDLSTSYKHWICPCGNRSRLPWILSPSYQGQHMGCILCGSSWTDSPRQHTLLDLLERKVLGREYSIKITKKLRKMRFETFKVPTKRLYVLIPWWKI